MLSDSIQHAPPISSAAPSSHPVPDLSAQLNDDEILETTASRLSKLKELNYSRWKSAFTNTVQKSGLWGYIDGSVMLPLATSGEEYKMYFRKSNVVLDAITKALEPGALKYIEGSVTAREAWLTLEQKYQSANDNFLASVEQQLSNLKLADEGDIIEHVTTFKCLCQFLSGTRFALDNQASIYKLYRSLPSNHRQWAMNQGLMESEDFELLCSSLKVRYLDINRQTGVPTSVSEPPTDFTDWGVPGDIKALEITGGKNPLLAERAKVTCRDCLLKDHVAGTSECPQFGRRKELWGQPEKNEEQTLVEKTTSPVDSAPVADSIPPDNEKATHTTQCDGRLIYEFSEPVKVVSEFEELGLNQSLLQNMRKRGFKKPSEIQKCAILPIISGRDVIAQAEPKSGKTAAIAISVLQSINANIQETQAIVLSPTPKSAVSAQAKIIEFLSGSPQPTSSVGDAVAGTHLRQIPQDGSQHVVVDTPDNILDMIRRDIVDPRYVKILVLDDADKLADNGFTDQIFEIHRSLILSRQVVVLCSVSSISAGKIFTRLTNGPIHINALCHELVPRGVKQFFMTEKSTTEIMSKLYKALGASQAVVFCNTQDEIDWLYKYNSSGSGYFYGYLYDLRCYDTLSIINNSSKPDQRDAATYQVSNNSNFSLLTTETWTQGFSTQQISLVVNYGVPSDRETYLGRISDFGKFGKKCLVINLVTRDEISIIQGLEQSCGFKIPELKLTDLGKDNR